MAAMFGKCICFNFTSSRRTIHTCFKYLKYTQLTSVTYPDLKRGNYNLVSDRHMQFFQSLLKPHQILTDQCDIQKYNVDWMCSVRGKYIYLFWSPSSLIFLYLMVPFNKFFLIIL